MDNQGVKETAMDILEGLTPERRAEVEARLRDDVIAWFTTVRPSGRPDCVPIWYLWTGDEILIYSRPRTPKLRNLAVHPYVALGLDDTRLGWDVIRLEGEAVADPSYPGLDTIPAYVEKYGDRLAAIGYDSPRAFAADFSVAIVVTVAKLRT
ncbi:pyridoxamine 5'-phosphate oxidase family protein [Actinopolymorpha sp. B9G3]|uniref:pyridoxamine 5'-phosphate oxidase family protein n=1 Tax=Actinopolymorpha sp. B9G3 TaxID=3158970 RepID=UPI0032D97B5D